MSADARYRYRFADIDLLSASELPELTPSTTAPCDDVIMVRHCESLPAAAPLWFHHWDDTTDVWARFGAIGQGWVVEFPSLGEFRIAPDARSVDMCLRPGVPAFTGRHLLLNQVVPLMLSRLGRLVLHAGAVSIAGCTTAFIGPTGSGKSTLVAACAGMGAEAMADDSLVVHLVDGIWQAVPSYPALRLWPSAMGLIGCTPAQPEVAAHYTDKQRVDPVAAGWSFASGARPLRRIVILGEEAPRPVAVELYSQVFRLDVRDQAEALRLFHLIADLAADVDVVRLADKVETRHAVDVARRLCAPGVACGSAFGA